jgi:MoaA/NifB/PqqE/SkfB family radical SAM enzyme
MDPKRALTNGVFCPMPFKGLMYNFDGKVKNCIRSSGQIGDLKDNKIEDIVRGEDNQNTQDCMLNDKPGPDCGPCYELEKGKRGFDIISDRIFYIRELKNEPFKDYKKANHTLRAVDVRWTNLCNFACVYCSSEFSSKWASEMKQFSPTPNKEQLQEFKNYIFENAHQLRHVYMAGGEPLQMKQNEEFLDLLARVNPNVNLRINTNLSKTDTQVFNKICQFKNVHWTISVETIGDEFEYIRYGGKWLDFLDNLKVIQTHNHKISFNMLYFLLNYNSFFDTVEFFQNKGFHNNCFIAGPLLSPFYLNARHLPESVLQLVKFKFKNKIDEKPGYLLEESYINILNYLNQPFEKNLSNSFSQLKIMDQRRNIDSSKVFKDLYSIQT